jgi:hypothetical protein
MPFLFCGAWSPEQSMHDVRFPRLLSWIESGITAAKMNTNEAADALGVTPDALSNMRAFRTSGPGILRFAGLPKAFWIGFIQAAAKDYCLRLVTDGQIDKLIAFLNVMQVERLDYQSKRMAKADLEDTVDIRKRA